MEESETLEDNIIKMPDLDYEPNPNGIGYELFHHMLKNKLSIAQIDAETAEQETYAKLLQKCIRTAMTLKECDITSTDIICVLSNNRLNSSVPYIAGLFICARVCSLDSYLSPDDCEHIISVLSPKIIFVVPEKESMLNDILYNLHINAEVIVFENGHSKSFNIFLQEKQGEKQFTPDKVDNINDTAAILFSSGMSGLAKGICLSHYTILCQVYILQLNGFDSTLIFTMASLYWISGVLFLLLAAFGGTTRLLGRTFSGLDTWEYISKYRVTMMYAPVMIAANMIQSGRPDCIDTSKLQDFYIGGTCVFSDTIIGIRDLLPGTNVFQTYGLTELAGTLTIFKPCDEKDVIQLHMKPLSCGKPVPGFWYKIVDVDTEEIVGCNLNGELRVKTKIQLNGYFNMDSSEVYDSDNWVRTGDIVFYDKDQCFFIIGRIKETIKYRCWHIQPIMIESLLQKHPAVKMAAVLGKPDRVDGEHPTGVVVLNEDAGDITPEMLVEYVNARLDEKKHLRGGVIFVEKIPCTASGKIKRYVLHEMIRKQLEFEK